MPNGIRSACTIAAAIAMVSVVPSRIHAQKGPTVDDVVKAASDYVQKYSEDVKAVSAEEEYLQENTSGGQLQMTRRMTSDVMMLGFGRGIIGSFRDVAIADGHAVNAQRDRLKKLFAESPDGSIAQARDIAEGGVKQYLNSGLHAFDQPFMALDFLKPENRDKVTFKLDGVKNQNGVQVATLKYTEKAGQHVEQTPVQGPINGRIQVEMPTGVVRSTEMIVTDKSIDLRSTVVYAHDTATGLWLPATMDQNIDVSGDSGNPSDMGRGDYAAKMSLEGHAKYSKFAKTGIDVTRIR